jgi:hypothetical protein
MEIGQTQREGVQEVHVSLYGVSADAIPKRLPPLVAIFDEWVPQTSIPWSLVTDSTIESGDTKLRGSVDPFAVKTATSGVASDVVVYGEDPRGPALHRYQQVAEEALHVEAD